MTAWETFPHESDIGVRGRGATLAEAFAGAATAMTSVICDPALVEPKLAVSIDCTAPDRELLLTEWLNALVYEMATRRMLFARFDVRIDYRHLRAIAWGEPVGERHQAAVEVKGATFCELKVAQDEGGWIAQCVIDV